MTHKEKIEKYRRCCTKLRAENIKIHKLVDLIRDEEHEFYIEDFLNLSENEKFDVICLNYIRMKEKLKKLKRGEL